MRLGDVVISYPMVTRKQPRELMVDDRVDQLGRTRPAPSDGNPPLIENLK